jgi:cytochrome d ubiquinol oxidase subunit I
MDLIAAREQMALSLGWHIILACLGIGLPGLTAFMEWRGIRTGDGVYTLLAHRWAKAMGVLFAVGAVSGTILSFELGLLWPGMMGIYGQVIGLPFALEGFAFFIEAIFIGIYLYSWDRYSWDRLPPRAHLWTALPVTVAGLIGRSGRPDHDGTFGPAGRPVAGVYLKLAYGTSGRARLETVELRGRKAARPDGDPHT